MSMIQFRQRQRIFILSLLALTVFSPLILFYDRLKLVAFNGQNEFVEDLSSIDSMMTKRKTRKFSRKDLPFLEKRFVLLSLVNRIIKDCGSTCSNFFPYLRMKDGTNRWRSQ